VAGEAKQVHGGYHVKLGKVPGAESGLLFYSATSPSGTLDTPDFKTWDAQGNTVNSLGAGRQAQWTPLTLTRGVDDNKDLYEWFKQVQEKGVTTETKKDLELTVLSSDNKTLHTWNLVGAVITRYEHSAHNAQTNEILVNTVEIKYEYAELK
jgi:phage tail-like protein